MNSPPSPRVAFEGLVIGAGVARPDGRPLYAYRFDKNQFEGIRSLLRRDGPKSLATPYGAALFVAFVAEWFRRERAGGRWDWIAPLASIGIGYRHSDPRSQVTYGQIRDAALEGLRVWSRPKPRPGSLLLAVVSEAGFPASAIRGNARLAAWLRRSVLAAEAGETVEGAVTDNAWRAPETVVQVVVPAAVQLCGKVIELRRLVDGVHSGSEDPVVKLDRIRSGWRNELPFAVEEQDIRLLVDDLVRARASDQQGALFVVRKIRRDGSQWSSYAELTLSGVVDQRRLPEDLRAELSRSERVRLAPAGVLAEQSQAVAALEKFVENEETQWELRPLVRGFETSLPLDEEFRLVTLKGERRFTEFTAFAGDPLLDPVIVARPPTVQDVGDVGELEVLGTSSIRSTRPWLALAVAPVAYHHLVLSGDKWELGTTDDGRRLIAFSGRASITIEGVRFVWTTGADRDEGRRLVLVGPTWRRARRQVFIGSPAAWLLDGEYYTSVKSAKLFWRAIGDSEWRSGNSEAPLGRIEFACMEAGEIVASARAAVVPAELEIVANTQQRTATLSGFRGAVVRAKGERPLPSTTLDGVVCIDLRELSAGSDLNLQLQWRSTLEITLADPTARPTLLNPQGHGVQHERLSLGRLGGYRLLAPYPQDLVFELRSPDGTRARTSRMVDGVLPLRAYAELVQSLLGSQTSLDAHVRITWIGSGDWLAQIGWYDLDQPLTAPDTNSPFAALARTVQPHLSAFSLTAPNAGVADDLPQLPTAQLRTIVEERLGAGPWMLVGRTTDGRRIRPRPLPNPTALVQASPLAEAIATTDMGRRRIALTARLGVPQALTESELRLIINHCKLLKRSESPAMALDLFTTLARYPAAALYALAGCNDIDERLAVLRLQNELPILWCATSLDTWHDAFGKRKSELNAQCTALRLDPDLPARSMALDLAEIADLQPTLGFHAQATFLGLGESMKADRGVTSRLRRPVSGSVVELAGQLVGRHAESTDPPGVGGLTERASDYRTVWERFDHRFHDVIAAPFVAAVMATGVVPYDHDVATRCRTVWLYDRDYFEAALAVELRRQAAQPTRGPR